MEVVLVREAYSLWAMIVIPFADSWDIFLPVQFFSTEHLFSCEMSDFSREKKTVSFYVDSFGLKSLYTTHFLVRGKFELNFIRLFLFETILQTFLRSPNQKRTKESVILTYVRLKQITSFLAITVFSYINNIIFFQTFLRWMVSANSLNLNNLNLWSSCALTCIPSKFNALRPRNHFVLSHSSQLTKDFIMNITCMAGIYF